MLNIGSLVAPVINYTILRTYFNVISGTTAGTLMSDDHLKLLSRYRVELAHRMEPDGILTHLQSLGALTEKVIVEEIAARDTRTKKVECLLDHVSLRPDSAFDALVKALDATSQWHLSDLLTGKAGVTVIIYRYYCLAVTFYIMHIFQSILLTQFLGQSAMHRRYSTIMI